MNSQPITKSTLNRRQFIQLLASVSAYWPISGFTMTDTRSVIDNETKSVYLNLEDPWLTIADVQEHLFPADETSPGAKDITALRFLRNMLDAPDTDAEEKEFLMNGPTWLNDLSNKQYQKSFTQLDSQTKEKLLRQIETSRAGSRWLSLMMSYLIEALLSDPVYGGNNKQQGWQWLEHIPGFPTPTIDKVYFKLGAHASPKRRTKA